MPIKLDWIDHNVTVDSRKVYRSTSKIDPGNLGTPLATLPGNALTYTDNTVQRGVTYHYVVTSIQGTDEAPSADYCIAYIPYTGPGPQTLARGTWEYGYFGRVPLEDIFSYVEIAAATGMTGQGSLNTAAGAYWHKVVYKGKILFFPSVHISTGISWQTLYNAGLVYGAEPSANWPAQIKTQAGIVPQNKVISSGNHRFVVRLPTSRVSYATGGTTSPDLRGGEIDAIFAGLYLNREFNTDNLPQMDDSVWGLNTAFAVLTPDYHSGTGASTAIVCRVATGTLNNIDGVYASGVAYTSVGGGATVWRPVLELVY